MAYGLIAVPMKPLVTVKLSKVLRFYTLRSGFQNSILDVRMIFRVGADPRAIQIWVPPVLIMIDYNNIFLFWTLVLQIASIP